MKVYLRKISPFFNVTTLNGLLLLLRNEILNISFDNNSLIIVEIEGKRIFYRFVEGIEDKEIKNFLRVDSNLFTLESFLVKQFKTSLLRGINNSYHGYTIFPEEHILYTIGLQGSVIMDNGHSHIYISPNKDFFINGKKPIIIPDNYIKSRFSNDSNLLFYGSLYLLNYFKHTAFNFDYIVVKYEEENNYFESVIDNTLLNSFFRHIVNKVPDRIYGSFIRYLIKSSVKGKNETVINNLYNSIMKEDFDNSLFKKERILKRVVNIMEEQ